MLTLVLVGCTTGPPTGTVSGSVKYNGVALNSGSVMFMSPDKRTVSATILSDGTYKATDVPTGSTKVGVAVQAQSEGSQPDPVGGKGKGITPIAIPKKYADPETSDLKLDVKAGANPPFDINIK
jgi:hypothetical protein